MKLQQVMLNAVKTYGLAYLAIIGAGVQAWYPTLNFWFLKAFEATWLAGAKPYDFVGLWRNHAFLYYLDWKLFGYEPWGWYATALLLHIIAALLLFHFIHLLTKNRLIGFFAGLIFVANTAYTDVLVWGSFNSYYPLIMIFMLGAFSCFIRYKETKNLIYYYATLVLAFLAFLVRETGLLIVPLISLYDLFASGSLRKKATWLAIIKRQAPLYLAIGAYLYLRNNFGGTPGDSADSNVKMQAKLLADKAYGQYLRVIFITFGKLFPPNLVPWPLLNDWRDSALATGDQGKIMVSYFPKLGLWLYPALGAFLLLFRRIRPHFTTLLYFWLWAGLFTFFVAFSVPQVHEVLIRPYEIIASRYHYFAFIGIAAMGGVWLTLLFDWLKKMSNSQFRAEVVVGLLVIAYLGVNLYYIRDIETLAAKVLFGSGKRFQTQFRTAFPTLPPSVAFYIYPHAANLNDDLFEWFLIKDSTYPNLKDQPYRIESQLAAVLQKVTAGKVKLDDFFFLDSNDATGLLDRTAEVRAKLSDIKPIDVPLAKKSSSQFDSERFVGPIVEIPYNLQLNLQATVSAGQGATPDSPRFRALADYLIGRKQFLDTVKLTSAKTMSQRDYEPFFHLLNKNLVDGNTGERSAWIADAIPAWVQAELPKEQDIIATSWGTIEGSPRTPSSYIIEVSADGQNWQTVKTVKGYSKFNAIDRLDKPVKARFVKMTISTTNSGDFVHLDEFEVITKSGESALKLYPDRDKLYTDSRGILGFMASPDDLASAISHGLTHLWGKVSWDTSVNNLSTAASQHSYFFYPINGQSQNLTIPIPESELFAERGQLLAKHLTWLSVELGGPAVSASITNSRLVPRELTIDPKLY